jgi:hypothetical protein
MFVPSGVAALSIRGSPSSQGTPWKNCTATPELCVRIVHPEDRQVLQALLRGEGPDMGTVSLRWISKSGAAVWIEQHYVLVREEQRLPAIECVARDITSRRQLEEQFSQA